MSIGNIEEFLVPDSAWEGSQFGRIDQGRRELAAVLRKDVSMKVLAGLVGIKQPSISEWKSGKSKPGRENVAALATLFTAAGLKRFTYDFLNWRPSDIAYVEPKPFELPTASRGPDQKNLRDVTPKRGKPHRKEA